MHRFYNSYYYSNTFLIFLYLVFRLVAKPSDLLIPDDFLPVSIASNREVQIVALSTIAVFAKYLKSPTWEHFFLNFFFFYKACFTMVLFFSNKWLMLWYLNFCGIAWMLFKMPFIMHENKFTHFSSVAEFESKVLKSDSHWVFVFYSPDNTDCISTNFLWCEISMKYTTSKLKFAAVNVSESIFLAQKCVVDCEGYSRQLPCLIVYSDGKESKRFPPVKKSGEMTTVTNYKSKDIVKFLSIDRLYLSTRDLTS